jgi:mannosyltransferase
VTLGAVLMLLPGETSLWLDETVGVAIARLDWGSMWSILSEREGNGGIYYAALHLWRMAGEAELWLRGLSIAAALGTIVVTYLLARRLLKKPALAAAAALVVAVNGLFLTEATEIRGYALTTLLVTWSSLLLVKAVQDSSRGAWLGYAVIAALSLYGHLFAAFVIAGQLCSLFFIGRGRLRRRDALTAFGLLAALAVPIGVFAVTNGGQIGWIGRLTLEKVAGTFLVIAGGLAGGRATGTVDKALGAVLALGYAAGFVMAAVQLRRTITGRSANEPASSYAFLFCTTVIPVGGALAVSLLLQPVFYYKYFVLIVPLLAILVVAGGARLPSRKAAAAGLAALCAISVVAIEKCYGDCNREDWKQATTYVTDAAAPGDGVILYAPYVRTAFDYYVRRADDPLRAEIAYPRYTYTSERFESVTAPDRTFIASVGSTHERVWLVLSHAAISGDFPGSRLVSWLGADLGPPEERSFKDVRVLLFSP